jgi:ribosomal protein S18 acetylase RimI-like enzyme
VVQYLKDQGFKEMTASCEEGHWPAFSAAGFKHWFARARMEASVNEGDITPPVTFRRVAVEDVGRLSDFFMGVYEGHMDQDLGMHVGTPEEWKRYIMGLVGGESGKFLANASHISQEGQRVLGAIIVTHWMGMPLVAEVGVARGDRGRGLGRALLQASMNALARSGEDRLALYVTVGNEPALSLYERMGFRRTGPQTVTSVLR